MRSRTIHKTLGLILLLPILGWTITGMIFFIKPGYSEAYQQLSLKTYPIEKPITVFPKDNWEEVRLIKTILGHHLLVKVDNSVKHLDPETFEEKSFPSKDQYKRLLEDAISNNLINNQANKQERYGDIVSITDNHAVTSTGVEIQLDWLSLKLRQKGNDTRLINLLYKIHYLQWTPFKGVNDYLGIIGLLLLLSMSVFGVVIYIRTRKR